ncbi:MAG: S49 family peptidase, partial [Caulobacterales bacterium]|nr:S49 family peptidase [Caulobacterales bacterium]
MFTALRASSPFNSDPGPVVPVVRLEGVIARAARLGRGLSLAAVEGALEKAFRTRRAAAVALIVNSPGGSPVQARLIHDRIRALAEENDKTVLVFCEDVAASGGYMIACAGDELFADSSSIVGSIGVIGAGFGAHDALSRLGLERRVYTSGA